MDNTSINANEPGFDVFCIENVAAKLGAKPEEVYKAFTDKSDILDGYIIPVYEALHTGQGISGG